MFTKQTETLARRRATIVIFWCIFGKSKKLKLFNRTFRFSSMARLRIWLWFNDSEQITGFNWIVKLATWCTVIHGKTWKPKSVFSFLISWNWLHPSQWHDCSGPADKYSLTTNFNSHKNSIYPQTVQNLSHSYTTFIHKFYPPNCRLLTVLSSYKLLLAVPNLIPSRCIKKCNRDIVSYVISWGTSPFFIYRLKLTHVASISVLNALQKKPFKNPASNNKF